MNDFFAKLFDAYSRQARLYPALLVISPAIITIFAWHPGLLTSDPAKTALTIIVSLGVFYALSVAARAAGKRIEPRLIQEWGGWPTTIWLRHRETHLDPSTRQRYHQFLASIVPGLKMPSRDDELRDPETCDQSYASAVKWLQERCRGRDWPMVEKENAEYGFRRNLRGLKPIGLLITSAALLWPLMILVSPITADVEMLHYMRKIIAAPPPILGALAVDVIAMFLWVSSVNDHWVRSAGDQFARALLAACDRLAQKP